MLWKPYEHELFVNLLAKEAEKGNRPIGGKYPRGTWSKMFEKIYENIGKKYTRMQLRHRFDSMRKAWKVWCQVVDASILKWDPVTRRFGATDEEWKEYIKENPKAVSFRRKVIPCEEKLAVIFRGIIEPGKPYEHSKGRTVQDHSYESLTRSEDGEYDDDDDDEPSPLRRRVNGFGFGEYGVKDVPICTPAEATKIREAPIWEHGTAPVNEYSIGKCIDRLDEMKEVERGKELYLFALDLFMKEEKRAVFLHLKDSTVRMAWLLHLRAGASPTVAAA